MKQRKRITSAQVLRYVAIALVVVAILSIAMLCLHYWEAQHGLFRSEEETEKYLQYNGQKYVLKEHQRTYLVMGLDKFEDMIHTDSYSNDQQADFLMVLIVDDKAKTCTSLQINRDAMGDVCVLDINGSAIGTRKEQLALAHTYGSGGKDSCRNTVKAVSAYLHGTPMDHYISMTMDAVATLNDLVDGVTLEVADDLTPVDPSLIKGTTVTLRGEQSLLYIRSRSSLQDDTNLARMARQRQYLYALLDKTLQCVQEDSDFAVHSVSKIAKYMVSDCTSFQLEKLFDTLAGYEFREIQAIQGNAIVGEKYMEFYADEDALLKQVIDLFYVPAE